MCVCVCVCGRVGVCVFFRQCNAPWWRKDSMKSSLRPAWCCSVTHKNVGPSTTMKAGLKPALHCKWGLFLSLKRSDSWSYCPIAYIASLDFLYLIVNTTYPSAKITLVFITLQRQRLIGMVGFFVQVRGKIWDLRITSFDNVVLTIACMHQFVNFSIQF